MRLTDIPGLLLEDMVRTLRRWVIAGVVILVCGIAALIQAVAAARQALEPLAGPVGARLIVMASFLVVAVVTALVLLRSGQRGTSTSQAANDRREDGDGRVAIIAEAIGLGYSLARDFGKASPASRPHANGADADGADANDGTRADPAHAEDTAPLPARSRKSL